MENYPVIKEYRVDYQNMVVEMILNIQQNEYAIPITKEDQPDLFRIDNIIKQGTAIFG